MLAPSPSRLLALAALVAALLVTSLSVGASSALAKSCKTDGDKKVCIAVQRESCSPGPPYRCRTARDEQHYRGGKFDYSQYQARRRICKGFGGTNCNLDYKTFCTTTRSSKRCRTDSGTNCTSGKISRCIRTVDSCFTRKGFRCRYTKVEERCSDSICRTTRLVCNSRSGRSKRCYSLFSKAPGRMQGDADQDDRDANLPFFEDDGSAPSGGPTTPVAPAPAPAPAPVNTTPACETRTTTSTAPDGSSSTTTTTSC